MPRLIVSSSTKAGTEYLVKWKDLPHEESTWENATELKDFSDEISKFEQLSAVSVKASDDKERRKFTEIKQPTYVPYSLYPFQLDGVNWLRYTWSERKSVILADEVCGLVF